MKRWIHASWEQDPFADLYVVKIWYEIDPGHDTLGPVAQEEIIEVVATSPSEALERAKKEWSGPIDRIEIVDINPEEPAEPLPFDAKTDIECGYDPYAIGGHLKHFLTRWAKECVETGHPVNDFTEFEVCLEEAGFDDLTPEEIDNGFEFYQEKIEEADRDVRSCSITATDKHESQCSFDFDLGDSYNSKWIEDTIYDLLADIGIDVTAVDFRSVEYPGHKEYSQCGFDFEWSQDYDEREIERIISDLIEGEGGNFLGIDFNSIEAATRVDSSVSPWKTKYTVHWISPDGNDCLLGGSNSYEEADKIGVEQARHIFESPFETDQRKKLFLMNMYMYDEEEGKEIDGREMDDVADMLMSEIDSRIRR